MAELVTVYIVRRGNHVLYPCRVFPLTRGEIRITLNPISRIRSCYRTAQQIEQRHGVGSCCLNQARQLCCELRDVVQILERSTVGLPGLDVAYPLELNPVVRGRRYSRQN